ncbi:hypothetical protein JEQ12_011249 [Ovis aries]|uniref:Uncharacterized protein n=1 Tax=Ovis aries TaxID=9940 RepID=A0A835ZUR0_SHEEP|nr:hypothetical protein JEQ12_011249 [Ovis aries]
MRETLWMPWNGLIVIGRKMELLGRKTQKPKTWDLKLESENWRLEDVEKTVLRGKSGRSPERMDVKRVRSVSSALQVSAGLRKDISKEMWGKQEFRHRVEAESESAGTVAGSRKGSEFKEKLKFTDVETSGEVLRARGYEVKQNEEELRCALNSGLIQNWEVSGNPLGRRFRNEIRIRKKRSGDLSSLTRGLNLHPLQWKGNVLTIGPPGKSSRHHIFVHHFECGNVWIFPTSPNQAMDVLSPLLSL